MRALIGAAGAAAREHRRLLILVLALVLLCSAHLGWHNSVDVYVSAPAIVVLWTLSGRLVRPRSAAPEASA